MTEKKKEIGDILQIMTIAVLFLVILMLVVFSAVSYQHAVEIQEHNNNERALLSYVVSCVKANAMSDIEEKDFDGQKGLAISMEDGKYERRIYMKDGKLLEEYAEAGGPVIPEDALVIGETETFEIERIGDDLLEIRTDAGAAYVRHKK